MKGWVLCAALTAANPVTTAAADVAVPRLSGAVALDGRLEERMWRTAVRLPHTAFMRWVADTYDSDPTTFHLRFFHDGRTLYAALVSYDRYVESDAAAENSDGLYSLSIRTQEGALKHYRLRWSANPPEAGGDLLDSGEWGARLRGPFDEPTRPGGGYVFEIAIPLSAVGWRPGDTIPVNIIVNDHDGAPRIGFRTPGVSFARFAWGSFDNDDHAHYRTLRLDP